MDQRRVSLNDPAFAGRLRQTRRSPAYIARPTSMRRPAVVSDIAPMPVQPPNPPTPVVTPALVSVPVAPVTLNPSVPLPPKPVIESLAHRQPQKSIVLHRSAVRNPADDFAPQLEAEPLAPVGRWRRWQPLVLYGLAILLFVVGATVAINGMRTNRKVAAQVSQITNSTHKSSDDNGSHPSTQKPTPTDIANYIVAPNLPRYIDIPKLAVHARVLSMGVTSSNQLKAPGNVYDAGWYNASSQPGQPGGMLIDGHISSWTTKGVFYGLNKLAANDLITVTRGDGTAFTYKVVKAELKDAQSVDMASLLVSQDGSKPGLSLISCAGEVIPGSSEFDKRMVVYAVLQ